MPFPRPRLTVRCLMIVVAVVAVIMGAGVGLKRRRDRFLALANEHWNRSFFGVSCVADTAEGRELMRQIFDQKTPSMRFHSEMMEKYRGAAKRPWLPVLPDPPEPEDPPIRKMATEAPEA